MLYASLHQVISNTICTTIMMVAMTMMVHMMVRGWWNHQRTWLMIDNEEGWCNLALLAFLHYIILWSCCTFCLNCCQRLVLHLNNLFYFLRALSNQKIPCQALMKINKRTTTKIKKWKWFRWSPKSQSLSSCQPSPLEHFPFHSAISYQCLLHWTKHPCSQLNAGCKIENVQTPILASWKKKSLILWDMWDIVITIWDFPTSFRFHFGLHIWR